MQAVIMAGGKGTRLASVTKNIPKPMVSVGGKPLLEHQIENLKANGIKDIILVVGYLGEVIREYFGNGSRFGVNIEYYIESTPLGTAGSLKKIRNRIKDDFIFLFGDLFVCVDFNRFYAAHKENSGLITLFSHPNSHPYDSDILITDHNDCVTEWSSKNSERKNDYNNLVNAGLYVVSKKVLDYLPNDEKIDFEKQLVIPLIQKGFVYAYRSTEYVKDIGTPERLHRVETDLLNQIPSARNLRSKQKAIFLDRDGTINKHVGFLKSSDQVELEPSVADAIRLINESPFLSIVITNQPVIARGECSFEELDHIHNRISTLLGKEGAYIDGLYYCPHHPDGGYEGEIPELKFKCDCRKPNIGLLKKAEKDFNIDLSNSWFVGDTAVDVLTGINAGTRTILLKSGDPRKGELDIYPTAIKDNLLQAVDYIMQQM